MAAATTITGCSSSNLSQGPRPLKEDAAGHLPHGRKLVAMELAKGTPHGVIIPLVSSFT